MSYSEEKRDEDLRSCDLWGKQVGEEYKDIDTYHRTETFIDINKSLIEFNFTMSRIADSLEQITIIFGNLANFIANKRE